MKNQNGLKEKSSEKDIKNKKKAEKLQAALRANLKRRKQNK